MSVDAWLDAAIGDATRRGLASLTPLLEGLAAATRTLRDSDFAEQADGTHAALPAGSPPGAHDRQDRDLVRASTSRSPSSAPLLTIAEFGRRWRAGDITAVHATERCLESIGANAHLNAFILTMAESALREATAADRERAAGLDRGPLHGVPVSIKDLFDVEGTPTTAASRVREAHRANADAEAVAALRRAGAVIVGKTNLHEFAFGTTNEESAFGSSKNPYDPSRSPGGSSGGSAVSVAAGMALASLGTDTGGSIRIPSAACGLVGLKPGYGEVSLDGAVPLGYTLDHAGPLALTVSDAWTMYDVLRSRPAADRPDTPPPLSSCRLVVPYRYFCDLLDEGVRDRFDEALDRLSGVGVAIREVVIPHAALVATTYLHIVLAEAAAYHARTLESCPEKYTEPVRMRLEMARYVQAEDYARANLARRTLAWEVDGALGENDVLALPTLPIPAPTLGAATVSVDGMQHPVRNLMLRLTQLFNLTGHPAISIPCGLTPSGLPVGLQLAGRRARTDALLGVALAIEERIARA